MLHFYGLNFFFAPPPTPLSFLPSPSLARGEPLIVLQPLPVGSRVMRVMPNTPALVQCGASVYVPGSRATADDERLTARLLSSVGTAERVHEYLMDPITALSGSGPAYVSTVDRRTQGGGGSLRQKRIQNTWKHTWTFNKSIFLTCPVQSLCSSGWTGPVRYFTGSRTKWLFILSSFVFYRFVIWRINAKQVLKKKLVIRILTNYTTAVSFQVFLWGFGQAI